MYKRMADSQKEFLRQHNIDYDFDNLSEEETAEIVDFAIDLFQFAGVIDGDKITDIGIMCEQIIDLLAT